MNPFWDERYSNAEFAYGKEPNAFFKDWLSKFPPGRILLPADGEGRNGVYAAELGWRVTSFDQSSAGRDKALQLARERKVTVDYIVGDLETVSFPAESFDAIGLVYAHFPAAQRAAFHKEIDRWLKPGGIVILEAFSRNHIAYRKQNPKVGGPDSPEMLYTQEEVAADFPGYEITVLKEQETELQEGLYHQGKGSVIRFVGRKPA